MLHTESSADIESYHKSHKKENISGSINLEIESSNKQDKDQTDFENRFIIKVHNPEQANFKFITDLNGFKEKLEKDNSLLLYSKIEAYIKSDKVYEMKFKSNFKSLK